MKTLKEIFEANVAWAESVTEADPAFFEKLSAQQNPEYLFIGCSDSRVPANQVMGLMPGGVFVHRNVANQIVHTDINMLSALQYAVDILGVRHVILCGHYGCAGVRVAMSSDALGLIDNWLRGIKDIYHRHRETLDALDPGEQRVNALCELNVRTQVFNICHTAIVQGAWERGQGLAVHGWIYGLLDGRLKDLSLCIESQEQIAEAYRIMPV